MTIDEAIKVAEEGATLPTVMSPPYDVPTVLALLRFVREHDKDMNGRPATNVRGPCTYTWHCSSQTKEARAAVTEAFK